MRSDFSEMQFDCIEVNLALAEVSSRSENRSLVDSRCSQIIKKVNS
jgi:hypothetical protein